MSAQTVAKAGMSSPIMNEQVKLVSQDGNEYILLAAAAYQSKVLRGFIEASRASAPSYTGRARRLANAAGGANSSASMTTVTLDLIKGNVLDLIVQYLTERLASNATMSDFLPLQLLDPENENDRRLVLDLLLAADFLEC